MPPTHMGPPHMGPPHMGPPQFGFPLCPPQFMSGQRPCSPVNGFFIPNRK